MTRRQLDELLSELVAIAFWDKCYQRSISHSLVETDAWNARRKRVPEILTQLNREEEQLGQQYPTSRVSLLKATLGPEDRSAWQDRN